MTAEVFNELLLRDQSILLTRIVGDMQRTIDTLQSKGEEYATNTDRFHNFNLAVELFKQYKEETKVGSALGMLKKHLVSIIDIVQKYEQKGIIPTQQLLDEKFGDTQAYLYIMKIMYEDIISQPKLPL